MQVLQGRVQVLDNKREEAKLSLRGAIEIAEELEKENNRRKNLTLNITNEALNMVENQCNLKNEKAKLK